MVLDSNGPTCIIKFKSISLKQKQTAQNYNGSGQMYVLSIAIDNGHGRTMRVNQVNSN